MVLSLPLSLVAAFLASTVSASVLPQRPLAPTAHDSSTPLPLVIWHGLGDNYLAEGLQSVGELAEAINPGTFVYYIHLDESASSDRYATFFGNVTEQVAQVCADLAAHPILSTAPAINGLGFSQGGQFLRAYVERCNFPPVANLVTFGSQHNGISEYQQCDDGDWVCLGGKGLLRGNTWSEFVQSRLVPAQYFRDPEELDAYLEHSNFLADVNNERALKTEAYKENLKKLDRFAMFMFSEDTTMIPKESSWFNELNATTGEVTKLQDRTMYKEDWIGLRWLDEKGRLDFLTIEGGHMQIGEEVLNKTFKEYFTRQKRKKTDGDGNEEEDYVFVDL